VASCKPSQRTRRGLHVKSTSPANAAIQRGGVGGLCKKINRSHTHTAREQHPRQRHTHTHTTRTTPQTNTSHKHLTTLEGGATTVVPRGGVGVYKRYRRGTIVENSPPSSREKCIPRKRCNTEGRGGWAQWYRGEGCVCRKDTGGDSFVENSPRSSREKYIPRERCNTEGMGG